MTEHPIHPNSMANLTGPKTKKEGHGYRYAIPREKVDELFSCLAEGMSLKKAAKEVDIDPSTARKYFREGDASRGIEPIIQRLTVFNQRIGQKLNVLLEEQRMSRISLIRNILSQAEQSILQPMQKFYDIEGKQIDVYDVDGKKIEQLNFSRASIRDLERLMKLEAFLVGGVTVPTQESSMMTAEQIEGAG
jgi:hypothetical protein